MRILFLSMEYPPETGGGGIGSYVAIIGEALTRRGHEIHVLSCVPGQASSDTRDGAVHVHRRGTPELGRLAGLIRFGKARLRLELAGACFREYRRLRLDFDLVESPEWMAEGFAFALLGSKPLVGHLHTPLLVLATHNDKPRTWDRRLGDAIERVTMSRAHLVTSHLLADDLNASGWLGDRKARVIRYPLDLDQWGALPSPEAAPPRILWVGRLEPRKAPETLVEAAAHLVAEISDLEVVFVGAPTTTATGSRMRNGPQRSHANWGPPAGSWTSFRAPTFRAGTSAFESRCSQRATTTSRSRASKPWPPGDRWSLRRKPASPSSSAERKPEPLSRPATPSRSPKLCARTSSTLHVRARTEDERGM